MEGSYQENQQYCGYSYDQQHEGDQEQYDYDQQYYDYDQCYDEQQPFEEEQESSKIYEIDGYQVEYCDTLEEYYEKNRKFWETVYGNYGAFYADYQKFCDDYYSNNPMMQNPMIYSLFSAMSNGTQFDPSPYYAGYGFCDNSDVDYNEITTSFIPKPELKQYRRNEDTGKNNDGNYQKSNKKHPVNQRNKNGFPSKQQQSYQKDKRNERDHQSSHDGNNKKFLQNINRQTSNFEGTSLSNISDTLIGETNLKKFSNVIAKAIEESLRKESSVKNDSCSSVEDLNKTIAELQRKLAKKEASEQSNIKLQEIINANKVEIQKLKEQNGELEKRNKKLDQILDTLRKEIVSKDQSISDLKKQKPNKEESKIEQRGSSVKIEGEQVKKAMNEINMLIINKLNTAFDEYNQFINEKNNTETMNKVIKRSYEFSQILQNSIDNSPFKIPNKVSLLKMINKKDDISEILKKNNHFETLITSRCLFNGEGPTKVLMKLPSMSNEEVKKTENNWRYLGEGNEIVAIHKTISPSSERLKVNATLPKFLIIEDIQGELKFVSISNENDKLGRLMDSKNTIYY